MPKRKGEEKEIKKKWEAKEYKRNEKNGRVNAFPLFYGSVFLAHWIEIHEWDWISANSSKFPNSLLFSEPVNGCRNEEGILNINIEHLRERKYFITNRDPLSLSMNETLLANPIQDLKYAR